MMAQISDYGLFGVVVLKGHSPKLEQKFLIELDGTSELLTQIRCQLDVIQQLR